MSDNESDGLIDIADLDPRIMPMFKTSPERIGLAIGDELEDWNSEFHDCDEVTWYSGEPPVQVSIGYVRADLYESMQSQLAAANERADAMTAERDNYQRKWKEFSLELNNKIIPERDAAVKALDMLHVAVCQAVVILNKSHATSMCDAHRILREALVAHADAAPVPSQPAVVQDAVVRALIEAAQMAVEMIETEKHERRQACRHRGTQR